VGRDFTPSGPSSYVVEDWPFAAAVIAVAAKQVKVQNDFFMAPVSPSWLPDQLAMH
jgi:hypothetical protein